MLLLLLLVVSEHVIADYEVEMTVHSYQNPTGRCDGCRQSGIPNPGCCDETFIRPSDLSCDVDVDTCDTTVDYCIRDLRSTANGCPVDQTFFSSFAVEETNTYSISPSFFGVDNPLLIVGHNKSWTGLQLYFQIQDAIIAFNGFSQVVLIDSVAIDIDIQIGTFSEAMLYIGNAGIGMVNASIEVRCAENFTGWDCLTLCPDFQSCTECGLPEFVGDYCQISNECACNASNMQCVHSSSVSFVCVCETGFTGEDCATRIDYCVDVNCSGNGHCRNLLGGFACLCEQGYTGIWCEAEINECASVTCAGNGRCVDLLNSFVCECNVGYTGVLCEEQVHATSSGHGSTSTDSEDFIIGNLTENRSAATARIIYYIIGGGVGGFLVLAILCAIVMMTVCVIVKSKKSTENLGVRVPEKGENHYEDPTLGRKLEDQKLNGIT